MKKLLAVALSLVFCASLSVSVFAQSEPAEPAGETIQVIEIVKAVEFDPLLDYSIMTVYTDSVLRSNPSVVISNNTWTFHVNVEAAKYSFDSNQKPGCVSTIVNSNYSSMSRDQYYQNSRQVIWSWTCKQGSATVEGSGFCYFTGFDLIWINN